MDAKLGGTSFKAYTYMGELPTGGFGVNSHGIGFSLNWVGPPQTLPGLGRGFISRSLLEAQSLDDAIALATRWGQGGGHNIQLFDYCTRRIVNVEVAQTAYSTRNIGEPFFHTNQYRTLEVVGQTLSPSSVHRLARVAEMPTPQSLEDMLHVLGDQEDSAYPIFHDQLSHARGELSDWTLATAVFDLDARTVVLLRGNPRFNNVFAVWNVSDMMGPTGCHRESPPLKLLFA